MVIMSSEQNTQTNNIVTWLIVIGKNRFTTMDINKMLRIFESLNGQKYKAKSINMHSAHASRIVHAHRLHIHRFQQKKIDFRKTNAITVISNRHKSS